MKTTSPVFLTKSIESACAAGGAETDACIEIYNQAMSAELGVGHWELTQEAWRDTFDGALWTRLLVGEQDGCIVGFVLSAGYAGISGGLIQMMAVDPKVQGHGVGGALLGAALEHMAQSGCARARAYVRVDSPRTQGFYRRCKGRVDISEPDLDYYGQAVYRVDFPLGAKPYPKRRM